MLKQEQFSDEELFEMLKWHFKTKEYIERGVKSSCSSSVREYLIGYINDYFHPTTEQLNRMAKRIADFHGIENFD